MPENTQPNNLEQKINKTFRKGDNKTVLTRLRDGAARYFGAGLFLGALGLCVGITTSCMNEFGQSSATSMEESDIYESPDEISEPDMRYDIHPLSKTCLIDNDDDGYGIKENNLIVAWEEECPSRYKVLNPPFDCNDSIKSINPEAKEKCNNIDDNCNKLIDEGIEKECFTDCGKGNMVCVAGKFQPCDTQVPSEEVCDGEDNNCNGMIDEGLDEKCNTVCGEGKITCIDGVLHPCDAQVPSEEICDGKDNNCNGMIDEWIECCKPGEITDAVLCPYSPGVYLFVIDNSGSMSSSDPKKLRYYGAIKFVENIEDNEKAGLIKYSGSAYLVGNITNNKVKIKQYLNEAINQEPDGQTNIPGAMDLALTLISTYSESRIIILLTDGESNVGNFLPNTIKSEAEYKAVKVFTVGLGNSVNSTDLKNLATSDGAYFFVSSAEQIASIYENILNTTKYESWKECDDQKQWIQKYGNCSQ